MAMVVEYVNHMMWMAPLNCVNLRPRSTGSSCSGSVVTSDPRTASGHDE